ncbi:MAG: hypothetical protein A2X34_04865 [Elusimicrobia bacterium GWC2_51_8]|nr:MAG: hypothetical protein A2X33_06480 [Elusimicrobia bacterium GWA2_51_34]OGR57950.1 MAG: hypothetical protein A2X34_04865 [Elusimicrobia bacterium GWC2_51_8]OGR86765.1 MAG: hypothetical protein A2021_09775 [Elusimicrobia bacterium GWF2_52_66]HAF95087.1 hypothetical protein [Elusimicrobiota bacterium]HCE99040.1 hypothetical protein [Elusimicrobiota bacterium]
MLSVNFTLVRAAAAVTLFLWSCGIAAAGDKLNVIIISFDLLRTDRLAAYGCDKNLAPNLDAFSRKSVVFLNAISPASWTLPAAMSVFTGLYPKQHEIINEAKQNGPGRMEDNSLDPGLVTLPEVFKSRGYETGAFTGGGAIWGRYGFRRGFDFHKYDSTKDDPTLIKDSLYYAKERLNTRSDQRPFFLLIQGFVEGNEVTAVDLAFGDFLAFLEKKGLLKNTVIAFLSHHGDGFGAHVLGDGNPAHAASHGTALYEELIHVPLMIYRPGIPPSAIESQVSLLDLGPTLIAAAGVGKNEKFAAQSRGIALYPFAVKENKCRNVFSETDFRFIYQKSAIRTCSGWKLIYDSQTSARELYDLKTDPEEKKNLFEKEPEIAGRLENELFDWLIE